MFFISYDRDGWDDEKGWSDSIFVNWIVCDLRVHLVVAGGSPVTTEPRGGISFGGITLSNDICDEDVGLCINVCREVALFNCDSSLIRFLVDVGKFRLMCRRSVLYQLR